MHRFNSAVFASAIFLIWGTDVKADWDTWGFKETSETVGGSLYYYEDLYTINSYTGEETFRQRFCDNSACNSGTDYEYLDDAWELGYSVNHLDKDSFILPIKEKTNTSNVIHKKYTLTNNTITSETLSSTQSYWFDDYTTWSIRGKTKLDENGDLYSDVGGKVWIKETLEGEVSWGKIGNSTAIYSVNDEGFKHNGTNLIGRSSDGTLSIGANSIKLKETSEYQNIWATNSNGEIAPINIINGTKLLINGEDINQNINTNTSNISTNRSNITVNKNNINNLGQGVANATALTAALSALPKSSIDSKVSCGFGTGTFSNSYALGIGCASNVNERVAINFGGSYIGGGAKDYGSGSLDNVAAKAGFSFKLGKINQPTLISTKEKSQLQESNIELREIIKKQNEQIAIQNKRLDKLERITQKRLRP